MKFRVKGKILDPKDKDLKKKLEAIGKRVK